MDIVGVCDWNAWLKESCLIYDNEKKSIVGDLSNIKIDFFNLKSMIYCLCFLSFL
jgi:hypothetical protein